MYSRDVLLEAIAERQNTTVQFEVAVRDLRSLEGGGVELLDGQRRQDRAGVGVLLAAAARGVGEDDASMGPHDAGFLQGRHLREIVIEELYVRADIAIEAALVVTLGVPAGLEAYEVCREAGAMIATAYSHGCRCFQDAILSVFTPRVGSGGVSDVSIRGDSSVASA